MNVETQPLPSEGLHWYAKDGSPCYQVEAKKGGLRDTTLADARKLDLVPSVTKILKVAAMPGLEIWKAQQILHSALTLPRIEDETLDDYAVRVVEDSKVQSQKARDKGHELHAAIEQLIRREQPSEEWREHLATLYATLLQHGIELLGGKAEHSFATSLGYGGKLDWHQERISDRAYPQDTWRDAIIIDFKTTEHLNKKQLVWPEHVQQLASYGFGIFSSIEQFTEVKVTNITRFRALNVFVGTKDKQVRVFEHEWSDLVEGFAQFRCLLEYWQRTKKFGPYAK